MHPKLATGIACRIVAMITAMAGVAACSSSNDNSVAVTSPAPIPPPPGAPPPGAPPPASVCGAQPYTKVSLTAPSNGDITAALEAELYRQIGNKPSFHQPLYKTITLPAGEFTLSREVRLPPCTELAGMGRELTKLSLACPVANCYLSAVSTGTLTSIDHIFDMTAALEAAPRAALGTGGLLPQGAQTRLRVDLADTGLTTEDLRTLILGAPGEAVVHIRPRQNFTYSLTTRRPLTKGFLSFVTAVTEEGKMTYVDLADAAPEAIEDAELAVFRGNNEALLYEQFLSAPYHASYGLLLRDLSIASGFEPGSSRSAFATHGCYKCTIRDVRFTGMRAFAANAFSSSTIENLDVRFYANLLDLGYSSSYSLFRNVTGGFLRDPNWRSFLLDGRTENNRIFQLSEGTHNIRFEGVQLNLCDTVSPGPPGQQQCLDSRSIVHLQSNRAISFKESSVTYKFGPLGAGTGVTFTVQQFSHEARPLVAGLPVDASGNLLVLESSDLASLAKLRDPATGTQTNLFGKTLVRYWFGQNFPELIHTELDETNATAAAALGASIDTARTLDLLKSDDTPFTVGVQNPGSSTITQRPVKLLTAGILSVNSCEPAAGAQAPGAAPICTSTRSCLRLVERNDSLEAGGAVVGQIFNVDDRDALLMYSPGRLNGSTGAWIKPARFNPPVIVPNGSAFTIRTTAGAISCAAASATYQKDATITSSEHDLSGIQFIRTP